MKKIFILDTNVLIHDPNCIFNFQDNDVYLPIYVIEEIDKLKTYNDSVGKSARDTSKNIDGLRSKGSLSKGIENEEGGVLKIILGDHELDYLPEAFSKESVDNKIIATALKIKNENPNMRVILITKDINVRIKSDVLDLEAVDYEKDKVDIAELYPGNSTVELDNDKFELIYKSQAVNYDLLLDKEPYANQMFKFVNNEKSIIGIYKKERKKIEKSIFSETSIWGVTGRNTEQKEAIELLMDQRIKIVSLVGIAGTGKTLLAIATALEQVVERKLYKKLFISRPVIPMGKDIGYLPGSEKEKMRPWMQPIYDNIEFLASNKQSKSSNDAEKVIIGLESLGLLKIEPLTYIRGRSIPQGFIIIDEAQNLTPHEIKTIITRVGKDTKIVLTGDPYQIDSPYLDENSNGLAYMVDKLKNEVLVGHITLVKGERSDVSELASKLL
ncbi:MAG: PhoH family protein [Sebaldella sp.]|nr:PhoH family protein [Sebaldella sp.]